MSVGKVHLFAQGSATRYLSVEPGNFLVGKFESPSDLQAALPAPAGYVVAVAGTVVALGKPPSRPFDH